MVIIHIPFMFEFPEIIGEMDITLTSSSETGVDRICAKKLNFAIRWIHRPTNTVSKKGQYLKRGHSSLEQFGFLEDFLKSSTIELN